MAVDVYRAQALERARTALGRYRGSIESGVGQAQTVAAVGGASYLAARLSAHWGGPEGKTILGVPLELAVGAACGALAMTGSAGKHTEEVLAVGVGAIAAYTARLGFQAGLATSKPPPAGAEVGAAHPALAAGPQYRSLPAGSRAQAYAPPPAYQSEQTQVGDGGYAAYYEAPPNYEAAGEDEGVGADPYAQASNVLDQYGRR